MPKRQDFQFHEKILAVNTPLSGIYIANFFDHLPFFVGVLGFAPPGLGSYSMRATTSYLYEGLGAMALFDLLQNVTG